MNLKLRAKILEKFGSQAEFSMAVKEDESTISRIIRNRRKPSEEQKIRWANIIGCKHNEIFSD